MPLTIFGSYEPGQEYRPATCRDPFGQECLDSYFEIDRVEVYVTEDWQQKIELCQVDELLKADGFYSAIVEKIEEGL